MTCKGFYTGLIKIDKEITKEADLYKEGSRMEGTLDFDCFNLGGSFYP